MSSDSGNHDGERKIVDRGDLPRLGRRSLSGQARDAILEYIMGNGFQDERVPPENELAEMLGVSRTTVRSALQSLKEAGLIVRKPGRGTIVRQPVDPSMLTLQRLVSFTSLLEESGLVPFTVSHLTLTDRVPDEMQGWSVETIDSEPHYLIDKIIKANASPAVWIMLLIPTSSIRGILPEEAATHMDWFDIAERYGIDQVDHVIVEIKAELADDKTAARLAVDVGAPVIALYESHYSEGKQLLGLSRIVVNQDYITFKILRTR